MNNSKIKICGIKDIDILNCCIQYKIDFFGLIFYEKSPRNIEIDDAIKLVDYSKNKKINSVGVFVNENINDLDIKIKKIKIDYIQLHGTENNDYIKNIKNKNKIKVIKAISINSIGDFNKTKYYNDVDAFLFDYKPILGELPGGNAKNFNWEFLKNINIDKDWFISGGINIKNINEINKFAIPYGIDISSGVEVDRGIKSKQKIIELKKNYESK